jgi:hypothetical protein
MSSEVFPGSNIPRPIWKPTSGSSSTWRKNLTARSRCWSMMLVMQVCARWSDGGRDHPARPPGVLAGPSRPRHGALQPALPGKGNGAFMKKAQMGLVSDPAYRSAACPCKGRCFKRGCWSAWARMIFRTHITHSAAITCLRWLFERSSAVDDHPPGDGYSV